MSEYLKFNIIYCCCLTHSFYLAVILHATQSARHKFSTKIDISFYFCKQNLQTNLHNFIHNTNLCKTTTLFCNEKLIYRNQCIYMQYFAKPKKLIFAKTLYIFTDKYWQNWGFAAKHEMINQHYNTTGLIKTTEYKGENFSKKRWQIRSITIIYLHQIKWIKQKTAWAYNTILDTK